MNWQPISTARDDGTLLLLYLPDDPQRYHLGRWSRREHYEHGKLVYSFDGWYVNGVTSMKGGGPQPTHWQELSPP